MSTEPIQPGRNDKSFYITFDKDNAESKAIAMHAAGKAMERAETILRSKGTNQFLDIGGTGQSIRDGFSREDYDFVRREEAIPKKPKDIIRACQDAYSSVGIIRNIIDLMADFATQGIDIYHPNERIETFYKDWFRRVKGKNRSERFLNLLYRRGNVVVKRMTAKVTARLADDMKRTKADSDLTPEPLPTHAKRELPWRYRMLNPIGVDVVDPELATFVGEEQYLFGIKISPTVASAVREPQTDYQKKLVEKIPEDMQAAIRDGVDFLVLDPKKHRAFYYKKDDDEIWAKPMVYSILADLQILQKMKLCDLAALDGAVSCIRVWKLGDIEAGILPTEAAINKLIELLSNNVGGGVMDLVWGPELDLLETKTDVHHFLGQTKYEPVLNWIYAGLGVPPTLTGMSAGGGGFNNNFFSLKTLTERLEYGREVLREFWEEEIRLVQQAMGFRFPATIVFDRMTLSDEAAEKKLLMDLWDRGLVSDETIVERFGENPDIEEARVRRDERKRANGMKPKKASPWHNPHEEFDLKKIIAQLGVATPSELGIELQPRSPGEKSYLEQNAANQEKQAKLKVPAQPTKPAGSPGRPLNKKDSQKRKQKTVKPRTSAKFFSTWAWVENAQGKINAIASPAYLKSINKKTLRELTVEEQDNFEAYKFRVLCHLSPNSEVDQEAVQNISQGDLAIPYQVNELLQGAVASHLKTHGKEPGVDVVRRYQAGVLALWHTDPDIEDGVSDSDE